MTTQTSIPDVPSPFAHGPYTDPPAAPEQPTDGHGFTTLVKLALLAMFVAIGIFPTVWPAGVIAGVLFFGFTLRVASWFIRKAREL